MMVKTARTLRLALFQPDIPQNAGTLLRLTACLGLAVDIVEPCGFILNDRRLRRAGMDYLRDADVTRHVTWQAFVIAQQEDSRRLVLLTTRADIPYTRFAFQPGDTLLLGRESSGVPEEIHTAADQRIGIPMLAGRRSINVALAAAMVVGEALRQLEAL